MIACIFGASGLVGSQLLYICLHDEHISHVKIFVRRPMAVKHEKLEQVLTDFNKPESWQHELRGALVFCCLGTTMGNAGSKEAFSRIDRDIPVSIAKAADAEQALHFLYVSALGASPRSANFYQRSKGETENLIMQQFRGDVSIVRPSFLLGHRREFRPGETIGKYLFVGIDKITFGLMGKYRPVHATEVAKALMVCARDKKGRQVFESNELKRLARSY